MLENENDDLFLSDIGDLSQIYNEDQAFNRNFGNNPRYTKRPGKNNNPHWEDDSADNERFKSPLFSNNHVAEKSNSKIRDPDEEQCFSTVSSGSAKPTTITLYDDADIYIPEPNNDSNLEMNEFHEADSVGARDGIYDEFELNESRNLDLNESRNLPIEAATESPRNKQSLSDSLSNFMHSRDMQDVPWRKNKPSDERVFDKRSFNECSNPSPPGVLVDRRMVDQKAFGKWLDEIPTDANAASGKSREQQFNPKVDNCDPAANSNKLNSNELLDEDYPNVNPFDVIKSYQSLKKAIETRVDDTKESVPVASKPKNSSDSKNEDIIRQTIEGIRKRFDDDIVILDDEIKGRPAVSQLETGKIKMSLNEPKFKTLPESNVDSSKDRILSFASRLPVDSGRKIPVLTKQTKAPSAITTTFSCPPPNIAQRQFATPATDTVMTPQPPLMMPRFRDPTYGMANPSVPNFMNTFPPENGGLFQPYGRPMMNNPPPPGEFFNPMREPPPLQYPNFPGNMHPPQGGWMPPIVPGMVSNPAPAQCPPSGPEMLAAEEDAQKTNKGSSNEAVKKELRQQNMSLMAQRDTYYEKYNFLNEELEKLKEQRKELLENKKSHQSDKYLKANQQLQSDIQSKIKAVKNVIDMLSKIIKDDESKSAPESVDDSKKKELDEKKESAPKSSKDVKKPKRKSRSRSRSRSRNRSRSRSRERRSRSRGRPSRSSRSRSRSYSPKRHRRRTRSRSRDKYYRRRRTPEKRSKYPRRSDEKRKSEEKPPKVDDRAPPSAIVETAANEQADTQMPAQGESHKVYAEKFKATFEEVPATKTQLAVEPSVPEKAKSRSSAVSESPKKAAAAAAMPPAKSESVAPPVASVNYVYYDPEIHWCQVCDVFPRTAKEYLQHLHDTKHKEELTKRNLIDYPWHKLQTEPKKQVHPDAPTERVPIRGLPFFVSATAWYCKLCNEWMGDLHCASAHLKSDLHEAKYSAFMDSNPLWEETWTQSRSKALELYSRASAKSEVMFSCAVPPSYAVAPVPTVTAPPVVEAKPKSKASKAEKRLSSSSSNSSSSNSSSDSSSSSDNSYVRSKKLKKSKTASEKQKKRKKESPAKPKQPTASEMRMRSREPPVSEKPNPVSSFEPPPKHHEDKLTGKWMTPPRDRGKGSFEPPSNRIEDDKFVEEWMNPVRGKSKEREFLELKIKLKKKEADEKNKRIESRRHNTESDGRMNTRGHAESDGRTSIRGHAENDGRTNTRGHVESDGRMSTRGHAERERSTHDSMKNSRSSGKFGARDRDEKSRKVPENSSRKANSANSSKSDADSSKSGSKHEEQTTKKMLDKPITISKGSKFPFIGKMPSKTKKNDGDKSKIVFKGLGNKPDEPTSKNNSSSELSAVIKKEIENYEKIIDPEQDTTVVDMDINDDEEEPMSYVVDDSLSRKKDFDETLKLLYPDENAKAEAEPQPLPPGSQSAPAPVPPSGLPSNLTQAYLVSLIESTLAEKLKLNLPGMDSQNSNKLMELMQQTLLSTASAVGMETMFPPGTADSNVDTVSEIPIPGECETVMTSQPAGGRKYTKPPPPPPLASNPALMANLADRESAEDSKAEVGRSSGSETEVGHKKKKNPISQKKRRHLAKIRQKLEEQEKQLQAKIEETKKNLIGEANSNEVVSEPVVMKVDSELMMLGIEEDDSAALQF